MMKRFLVILILFSASKNLYAQEILSLQNAIEVGLKNNYEITLAKNDVEIAKNNATIGNAGMLPNLDLSLTQNNSINNTNQKFSTGNEIDRNNAKSNSINAEVALDWTLFDGLKMFATYNKLKELDAMSQLQLRQTMEQSVADIINGYYDIARQKALLKVLDEALKISQVKLTFSQKRFDIGSYSKVELLQAKIDVNTQLAEYKKQLINIEEAKIVLNRLLARDVSLEYDISDSIEMNYQPTYEDLKTKTANQNTALQMAQKDISISNYYLKENKAARWPIIYGTASYSFLKSNSQASFVSENRNLGLNYGFGITMPLFNGFNISRNINNARIIADNSRILLSNTQTTVDAELLIAFRNFNNNLEVVKLQKENFNLSKENVQLSLERFKAGSIDDLQLREAQRSDILVGVSLVNTLFETKLAETQLKKLSGELLK